MLEELWRRHVTPKLSMTHYPFASDVHYDSPYVCVCMLPHSGRILFNKKSMRYPTITWMMVCCDYSPFIWGYKRRSSLAVEQIHTKRLYCNKSRNSRSIRLVVVQAIS